MEGVAGVAGVSISGRSVFWGRGGTDLGMEQEEEEEEDESGRGGGG